MFSSRYTRLRRSYDPLQGKYAEDDLYTLAKHLLYEPNEGDGKAFTQRATKMLTFSGLPV